MIINDDDTNLGYINIRSSLYNATGDGIHDDTNAFQQALNDVSKVSTIFEYFPSRFTISSELPLKQVALYVELNSASNGIIFKVGHRWKSTLCAPNTPPNGLFTRCSSWRLTMLPELVVRLSEQYNGGIIIPSTLGRVI